MLNKHQSNDVASLMARIGSNARAAARPLAVVSTKAKNDALVAMADAILRNEQAILDANAIDMSNGEEAGLSGSFMDRLKLTPSRIK
ncbi:gamma-glutamyl-phosphate reductase, partial [Mesorhizobium sp. M2D.F.Ca.ET.223.01.1.1]